MGNPVSMGQVLRNGNRVSKQVVDQSILHLQWSYMSPHPRPSAPLCNSSSSSTHAHPSSPPRGHQRLCLWSSCCWASQWQMNHLWSRWLRCLLNVRTTTKWCVESWKLNQLLNWWLCTVNGNVLPKTEKPKGQSKMQVSSCFFTNSVSSTDTIRFWSLTVSSPITRRGELSLRTWGFDVTITSTWEMTHSTLTHVLCRSQVIRQVLMWKTRTHLS